MIHLTRRESELVILGAAMGANCVPCIAHHIPEARKAGLTDPQIRAAIELADTVRQVPARNVLETATSALGGGSDATASSANVAGQCSNSHNSAGKCGC
jgi:4-carboxymuconolactone decarboxylase